MARISLPVRAIRTTEKQESCAYRTDGYINLLNKYGTQQDSNQAYSFQAEPPVSDMELAKNYEGNGLFSKIIDRPAEEAVKNGLAFGINDAAVSTYIEDSLDALDWEGQAMTAIKWARLFGGAVMVMLIDDGRGLEEPVDWEAIRGIEELRVFERPVVQPDWAGVYGYGDAEKSDVLLHSGEPEFYEVFSVYGSFTVHRDRCLVFKNGVLPEFYTQAQYRLWGMPEYVRIKRDLANAATAHGNGSKLLEKSVQAIYKMQGLAALLATQDGEEQVLKRLQVIDMARGVLNSIAIDSQGEEYDFKTFQLSGVKDIIDTTCNMLSAVTNIPQTVLFGRSPAGENSTGSGDMENYYNFIEGIQKLMLKKNVRVLTKILMKVGVYQGKIVEDMELKPSFKPLWSLSEVEQSGIDQAKAATALTKAQTAQVYVDMQALDPSEVRTALAKSKEYVVEDILDQAEEDWDMSFEPEEPSENPPESTENFTENKVQRDSECGKIELESTDGGDGSGRYPKGSGDNIEVDAATRKKYEDRLKKVKTVTGVQIKSISHHAMQRLVERKISEDVAAKILEEPNASYPGNKPNSTCCQTGNIRMVFGSNGNIITAIFLDDGGDHDGTH